MSLLDQLFLEYGSLSHDQLTQHQIWTLRNKLKDISEHEVTSAEQAKHFLSLLRKFREYIADADKLHGDNYPDLLSSLLSVGEDGLYSNNLRFIFELIQNVDDCEYDNEEDHILDIHFDFNHNKITLRYNEKGFTPFNVFAITGIAEAAKNVSSGKNEIGEKGIGFKSVFGVASKVWIRSGWFSFELHKDNFTIPVANYQDDVYCPGTEMTLFVATGKAKAIYDEIKKQYCTKDALFARNPLLFLNKLTKLSLHQDVNQAMTFQVTRSQSQQASRFKREDDIQISISLHNSGTHNEQNVEKQISCTRYSYSVVFSKAACRARYGQNTNVGSHGGKPMTLYVIFPHPDDAATVGNGALYSFLPTQLRFRVPLVCHVPFKLDASREFVDPQENRIWFDEACRYLSQLLDYAYQDWCKIVKSEILQYLPGVAKSLFADNNGKEKCLSLHPNFNETHFSDLPIFYTANGNFETVRNIFCFDVQENIVDPERVYRLMPFAKELFLLPKLKAAQYAGIYTERNIYQRLFAYALQEESKSADILEYLHSARYQPNDKDIPSAPFSLSVPQLHSLLRYESYAKVFLNYSKTLIHTRRRPVYSVHGSEIVPIQNVLYKDFQISEAPKDVENYLTYCKEKCLLMDISPDQYFPCHNALVLSSKNPLASFSAFCYAIDSKDTFSIRMKHKEISEHLNQLSESDVGSAEDYLRELRNQRKLVKDALGDKPYQNFIDLILKSGTSHTRFIQELLQNADDCEYADDVIPEFKLTQTPSKIFTQYNELGFTRGNIRSITAIGESTKNHLLRQNAAKIGEKGVGFKTIFAIASRVAIHSGDYHFSLADKTPTIPDILSGPVEPVSGTQMVLSIKDGSQLSKYKEQDILELCLCLRKLRRITINGIVVTIEDTDKTRSITINKKQHTFIRFVHRFSVSENALKERENGLRSISSEQEIVIYVPEKGAAKEYPLYSGLPTKHRIKVPLVIDAPFMLTTSREEIESGSQLWNGRVKNEMYAAILSVFEVLKHSERSKLLRYIKFVPRLQGVKRVYINDFSDCQYLNDYDYLSAIRNAKILPTFDSDIFVSAQGRSAFRYPEVANYLFSGGYFGNTAKHSALDIPKDDASDAVLNALDFGEVAFSKVYSVISLYANAFIKDAEFRQRLYSYLLTAPPEYRDSIKDLAIIPVYSVSGEQTEFIPWQDDVLFVKKHCAKSEHNYYILNENFLSKADCEKIFGENVNEMNAEWERNRYNDGLRDTVRGNNTAEIYRYLLTQFASGAFQKYRSQEILLGMKDMVPLKNQLGEIVDTGLFVCEEVTGFFQSPIILSMSVHDECKKFAEYLKCASLSTIHYQDIVGDADLTADDIEDFNTDYFANREEILRNYYRDGRLSDDLVAEYGLEYIAMQSSQDDEYLEFPDDPVPNIEKLRRHIQIQMGSPKKIVKTKVERTVNKYMDSSGNLYSLEDNSVRKQTLAIYTPEGIHGRCFCQLCRKVKPYEFMEVNNIIAEPEYFFHQTRVALCLECSKQFEAIRWSNAHGKKQGQGDPFLSAIRDAPIGTAGHVDVLLTKSTGKTIRFTATHLAEIQ